MRTSAKLSKSIHGTILKISVESGSIASRLEANLLEAKNIVWIFFLLSSLFLVPGQSQDCDIDTIPPAPFLVNLSTLILETEQVTIWAKDFDAGVFDACTPNEEIRFTFSDVHPENDPNYDDTINSSFIDFTCHNYPFPEGNDGVVQMPIYVWDNAGNFSLETVSLKLIDDICGFPNFSSDITLQFLSKGNLPVSGIEATLTISSSEVSTTLRSDEEGQIIFNSISQSDSVDISLKSDYSDYLNGVSTLDVVLIQKHILGITPFTNYEQYIAADATNDNNISAIDLIALRRLILGLDTEFSNSPSWKIVEYLPFLSPQNAFDYEKVSHLSLSPNEIAAKNDFTFKVIKIGDVNSSVQSVMHGQ